MTVYAPGTLERDPQKQNMALQQHAGLIDTANANIATNTANIATNTASIATLNSAPVFRVHLHTQHNGVNGNYAQILFDTVDFDTVSGWDAANYRYLPLRSGYYRVGWAAFGGVSTSLTRCLASLFKNGTEVSTGSDGSIPTSAAGISTGNDLVFLNGSSDYIDIRVFLSATGTPIVGATTIDYLCYFSANWLRP